MLQDQGLTSLALRQERIKKISIFQDNSICSNPKTMTETNLIVFWRSKNNRVMLIRLAKSINLKKEDRH